MLTCPSDQKELMPEDEPCVYVLHALRNVMYVATLRTRLFCFLRFSSILWTG